MLLICRCQQWCTRRLSVEIKVSPAKHVPLCYRPLKKKEEHSALWNPLWGIAIFCHKSSLINLHHVLFVTGDSHVSKVLEDRVELVAVDQVSKQTLQCCSCSTFNASEIKTVFLSREMFPQINHSLSEYARAGINLKLQKHLLYPTDGFFA